MSLARRIAPAPSPGGRIVSLDEWRARRRGTLVADTPAPPALRLVGAGDPPPFRLDVFLHRARVVMAETPLRAAEPYPDAEPA
jgi:hypothetical protein